MKTKNLLTTLALTLVLLLAGKVGWGQPLFVENFDYPSGDILTSHSWIAHSGSGTNPITVVSPGLTFSNYPSSNIGLAAGIVNTGEDINHQFPEQTSGSVYAAFIIKTENINSAGYFFHLGQSNIGTTFFTRVWVNGTGDGLGLGSSIPADNTYVEITSGTPTLVVVKYVISEKKSSLFVINGTIPSTEPTADTTFTETATISNVGSVALRQYNANQKVYIDGIRVATSWDEAVKGIPPTWTTSYPTLINITPTTTDLTVNINEPGTAYYVVLPDGATAPTAAQVKAGNDAGGNPVSPSGSISITSANTDFTATISGLTASTAYDVYVVAEDDEATPNLQANPVKIDLLTANPDITAPVWTTGYPKVEEVANNDFNLKVSTDEVATAYYVVLSDGSAAPNAAQVKAGTDGSNVAAFKSGSVSITTANTQFVQNIAGLAAGTTYDVYVVAEDPSNNLQTSPAGIENITTTNVLTEPTNHATAFAVSGTVKSTEATLTWTDADPGSQAPEKYVIVINTSGTFTVTDGTPIPDDTDFSDDAGAINVAYGVQTVNLTTLLPGKNYTARIYPYTNSGTAIDYKTDGTVPETTINTPSITVTYPNGDERFTAGENLTITWTSANMGSETIKCEVYARDGLTTTWNWIVLGSGLTNNGTFNLTIPTDAKYGTQYKIRLTGETSGTADSSDAAFRIIATPSIYQVQSQNDGSPNYASLWANDTVRIAGIVTGQYTTTSRFFVQDSTKAWNGIYVYNAGSSPAIGDSVWVQGKVTEYNGLTEIAAGSTVTVKASGKPLPTPIALSTLAVNDESYESVLVKVTGATCMSGSSGNYTVNNGSGDLVVYKSIFAGLTMEVGRKYDITGIVGWYKTDSIYQLYPRSADDIYLYSNDSTLSAFTLGGQEALALTNVNVADTINNAGATMFVSNFTGFAGIAATTTNSKATFKVTLNGAVVDPASYTTQTLADGDLVVVTVTAEDGTLGFYKVTLTGENRTLSVTAPAGGETYQTGDAVTITWTSSNITNVNIYAEDATTHELYELALNVDASTGSYTYTILNGQFGVVYIRIADAADANFYATSAGTITVTDNVAPSITNRYPAIDATNIATSFTLSIKFDEDVKNGNSGNMVIYKASDNTAVATITFTNFNYFDDSLAYEISGLDYSTTYYISMPSGFVVDSSNNGNAAIAANAWTFTTMAQPPMDLFFSEYIEGSSNNKALEIYNPTDNDIDLSSYLLRGSSNAATNWENNYPFPNGAVVPAHGTYVIVDDAANAALLAVADWISTGFECGFNGNDARGLFKINGTDSTLIDLIGDPNNPGQANYAVAGVADACVDHTLVRKSSITSGNTNWASSAGTDAATSEWEIYNIDDFSFLGWHINKSSEKDILSFELAEQTGPATIDAVNHTVTIEVVNGTSVTALTPTITISKGASISPASGVAQNYTNPVTYTVTAQDGTTQNWEVTVTVATTLSSQKDILTFEIPNQISSTIDANAATVTVVMPYGTDLTNLTPTITVSAAASISPASGVAQNFTNPVTYTVTAQDGTTKAWTITITVQSLPLTSIYQIQYTTNANGDSPLVGEQVKTKGCVTAIYEGTSSYNVWIQDSSKAWNGIEVYGIDNGMGMVSLGDTVEFVGTVEENYNLTRINNVTHISVKNSGSSISPLDVSIADALTEAYEGLFVKLSNVECTNADAGYGMFEVSDGTNTILIDDDLYKYTPSQGMRYNIVGLAHYSYSARKILPRAASDIEVATTKYNITFNVKRSDGTTAVADATITVTGQGSVTTDANGVATMQLPNGDYSYVVIKTNFNTYNGTFTVADADQSVNITLIQTGITPNPIAKLNVYPNPFTDRIYFTGTEVTRVTITSVIGQVVMDCQVENTESVDVSSLDRGIYLVRFYNSKGESVLRKLAKQE